MTEIPRCFHADDHYEITGRGRVWTGRAPFAFENTPEAIRRAWAGPWTIDHPNADPTKWVEVVGVECHCVRFIREGAFAGIIVREMALEDIPVERRATPPNLAAAYAETPSEPGLILAQPLPVRFARPPTPTGEMRWFQPYKIARFYADNHMMPPLPVLQQLWQNGEFAEWREVPLVHGTEDDPDGTAALKPNGFVR